MKCGTNADIAEVVRRIAAREAAEAAKGAPAKGEQLTAQQLRICEERGITPETFSAARRAFDGPARKK
jgi:hypothetical protein